MVYDETGSGGCLVHGCAILSDLLPFVLQFKVGDTAFLLSSALKGKLEPIAVRSVVYREDGVVLWTDSFNALFGDGDLITQAQAQAYAVAYEQQRIAILNNLINSLCPVD